MNISTSSSFLSLLFAENKLLRKKFNLYSSLIELDYFIEVELFPEFSSCNIAYIYLQVNIRDSSVAISNHQRAECSKIAGILF